ncbi:MAG TPA: hypothetical protein VI756_32350 [Blastocatellia bacterium]
MSSSDLWPDNFGTEPLVTPASILRAQAAALGRKTNHLVEGEVEPRTTPSDFIYSLDLVAPALDNYRYRLLTIRHGIGLYPVAVSLEAARYNYEPAKTQAELEETLRMAFGDDKTILVIRSLIKQSEGDELPLPKRKMRAKAGRPAPPVEPSWDQD